jgi:hypothetical protein
MIQALINILTLALTVEMGALPMTLSLPPLLNLNPVMIQALINILTLGLTVEMVALPVTLSDSE